MYFKRLIKDVKIPKGEEMDTLGEKLGFIAFLFAMMSISSSPHPILLIACYGIHEGGHFIAAKLTGAKMKSFRAGFFRLCLSYDCSHISYAGELLVCAGGIIVNLSCALLSLIFGINRTENGSFFIICNLSLAIMNIYPISILDGGGILRCLFLMLFDEEKARKTSAFISFLFAFLMWLGAVYLQLVFDSNISLFLISVFLLIELCFSM